MKILIIADPLDLLLPPSDTGIMIAYEALKKKHTVYWTTPQNIGIMENKVFLSAQKIIECEDQSLPKTNSSTSHYLDEFNTVSIRKDPPFDAHYVNLCWLLRLSNNKKTLILNAPETLLLCHEKLLPLIGLQQGFFESTDLIPSTLSFHEIKNYSKNSFFNNLKNKEIIVKPWLGHGGNEIKKAQTLEEAFLFIEHNKKDTFLIQPFQKEVEEAGDRRAFFIHSKYCGGFVRLPKKGGFISNIAQGGTGVLRDLTEKEKVLIPKIENFLRKNQIFIAGVDLLNGLISEVNITAPTGFQKNKELTGGENLAAVYISEVEKLFLEQNS